ncbi:hypothetical protein AW27_033590 [Streptomyces sp. PCS3-D2]|uniref:hypothetical protein n=1 Tax=Streptomyces sp. PCS3-D2 TaxID=1460244 RepID=UPI002729579A|nr:hypothetical protein [Streptomyces sp. PCS3-D2]WKV76009.1 hypothetical protein AW27_033590 [Streptomyces sp. PCS3-D2]
MAGHGWRWIDYRHVPENVERDDIARTAEAIGRLVGRRPVGWYTGRTSANTRRPGRRGGRLPLRQRRLLGRPAVLCGGGRPAPAPGGAVQPRRKRLQVPDRPRLHHRGRHARLPGRHLRDAPRRGRGPAADDERRHALPNHRAARANPRARRVLETRRAAGAGRGWPRGRRSHGTGWPRTPPAD